MDEITVEAIYPNETGSFIKRFKEEGKFVQIELISRHLEKDLAAIPENRGVGPEYFVAYLGNTALKETGYRIDIIYTISDLKKIIIQSFIEEQYGSQETTAYVVKGNMLFSEYFTDDNLVKEKIVTKHEWNGDVVLEMREFERESKMLK